MTTSRRECIENVMSFAGAQDDGDATIIVCRDLPGDHIGGRECWCIPHVIASDDPRTLDQIMAEIEARERRQ